MSPSKISHVYLVTDSRNVSNKSGTGTGSLNEPRTFNVRSGEQAAN